MSGSWLEQSISEVLVMAQAAGRTPSEVATLLHAGKLSLDHVPGRVGIAVTAAIVSRHLPDEIREKEQAERAKRDAEEGQKSSITLRQILTVVRTWEALPEDQRAAKAVRTRQQVLDHIHGVIHDVEECLDPSAWRRRPEAQGMFPIQRRG